MRNNVNPPVYSKVAFDIATRIATREIEENTKFTGRSLMSTQYGVSQETIRRAFKLLDDVGIVSVRQNVGAIVLSKKKASEYIEKFKTERDLRFLKHELHELQRERDRINERIDEIVNEIADFNERFKNSDPLRNYEFQLEPNSKLVGMTIRDSQFWQKTEATIVAIISDGNVMLSPGPSAVFSANDIIVVAGRPSVIGQVKEFIES